MIFDNKIFELSKIISSQLYSFHPEFYTNQSEGSPLMLLRLHNITRKTKFVSNFSRSSIHGSFQ